LGKNLQIQILIAFLALLSGCAVSPDIDADSAMPTLNAEALSVCTPLQSTDFAFTSTADGDSDIYLYQASTASIVRVTDTEVQDHWATWSRDGRMLAFQSLRDGNREIYIKVFPDGEPVNSSQHEEQDLVPSWSPNNNYIVYHSSRDLPWSGEGPIGGNLYVMRVQGAVVGRIQTEPFMSPSMIAWSPDSTTLFYARFGAGKEGIYALDLATGEETALLALENLYPGVASANPSAGTVDYYVQQDGVVDIYQLSLVDGFSRKLTSGEGKHYYANWSPDRSALLVTSAQDAAGQLYDIRCVAADGSYDVPVIDDASDARSAAWRPNIVVEIN
jgi:TolB protein